MVPSALVFVTDSHVVRKEIGTMEHMAFTLLEMGAYLPRRSPMLTSRGAGDDFPT